MARASEFAGALPVWRGREVSALIWIKAAASGPAFEDGPDPEPDGP